ncbi:MAG: DUF748 domain-containing protein [Methylococcaceae bacterium]
MWHKQTFITLYKKSYKPVLLSTGLVAVYALFGFKLLPYLLKTQLPELITQQTKTPATLADATFNPFTFTLSLTGFELQDKQKQPLLKFDGLFVAMNALASIKTQTLVIEQLRLDKPQTHLVMVKDGYLNVSDLLPPSTDKPREKEQALFPLLLKQFQLNQGSLTWIDQRLKQPETATLTPINVTLTDLSLQPGTNAQLTLSTLLQGGGEITWKMELSPGAITSKGHIDCKGIKAERLWALGLQDHVNFKLPQGESDLSFTYQFAYLTNKFSLLVNDGVLSNRKFQLTALDNPKPLIDIPELTLRGITFDLLAQKLSIAAIESTAPRLTLSANAAGDLNVQALFAPKTHTTAPNPSSPSAATPEQPWLINIATLAVHKLQADYSSESDTAPLNAKLSELNLGLSDYQLNYTAAQLNMHAKTSNLALKNLALTGVSLQEGSTPLQVSVDSLATALSNIQLDYAKTLNISADNGGIHVQNAQLNEPTVEQALMTLPDLNVNGAKFDLAKQQLDIAQLQASGATFRASLSKEGQLNYQALLATKTTNTPTPVEAKVATLPWAISLSTLDLQNFQFNFQDKTHPKPLDIQLSGVKVNAKNLSNQPGKALPFTLHSSINTTSSLDLSGHAILEPFSAELQTTLNKLELKPFQDYLNDYLRADIIDGALNTSVKITLNKTATNGDLSLHAKGNASVKQLLMRDPILNKDLIKWQSVTADAIDFDLAKLQLNVGHVLLQAPYARVTIKKDRSLNFDDLIVKRATPDITPAPITSKKSPVPQYKIEAITIANGSSDFSDFSLILPFVVQLNAMDGGIKRISSEQKKLSDFTLVGKVFDLSPMEMEGKFSPDLSELDIGMHFKGMPLPFISPYMVEFAGYKIEKGKMSLDLLYKISDRKLVAENNMVLDQLTLGEKIENPKATSLPLNLAISLLKDADGKIAINLPLTGSLDDPQFSVMDLAFDALMNMITKTISSPFKVLGSLMGSDADLSQVSFKEGSEALTPEQENQLLALAKGLAQKTDLSVEIKGSAYSTQDWPAMQDDALLEQLKAIKAAELKASGQNKLAEYVELSARDYQRLLADLFIKKFPHLAKRSLLGTPELIGSTKDFTTIAKQQLAAIIPPNNQMLATLAAARARSIAQTLIQKGHVSHERVFILDVNVQPNAPQTGIASELSLNTQ